MENFQRRQRHTPSPSTDCTAQRSRSGLSTLSTKSGDSESTANRKEALRIFRKEELPSVYSNTEFNLLDLMEVPIEPRGGAGSSNDAVDWDGGEDKAHPINWPTWKKAINIVCLFLMSVVSPFTSSVFAPAIPDMMKDFETRDQYLSSFVLSIYVLGYAVGPLLISPFSELYGRLPIYHCCNVLFTICTWRCAYAGTLRNLAVLRFFAGVGGSSVFALVPSSIADMIVKERRAPIFGLIALGYNLGPAVSPTAGSYINAALGWKWIFHVTAILGGAMTVLAIPCLYETYEPTLLRRKAKKQRKTTGNPHLRSRLDIKSGSTKPKILARAMVMPLRMLATPPIFLVSLLTAVGYGWLYILYITLPHTFLFKYGWPSRNIGLAYLGTAVGNIVGMVVGVGVSDAIMKRKAARGDRRPENRLLPMVYLWPLVSIGLVIYGWTAQTVTHFMGPMIGTAIFGAGVMAAIFCTGTYIVDAYPLHNASGMAASSLIRSIVGGLAPLFSEKLYTKFDVGWAFTLLAGIVLAFAPIPWLVHRYGEKWRRTGRLKEDTDVEMSTRHGAGGARAAEGEVDAFLKTIVAQRNNV